MARSAPLGDQGCRVDGCGNKIDVKKYRLCSKHHQAFWKYGDPLGSPNKPQSVPCTAPDCDRMGSGNTELCHKHYLRLKRTGRLDKVGRDNCSEAGCPNVSTAKGLCQTHYDRQRGSARRSTRTCSRTGCERDVKARGVCHNHYAELQRQDALDTAPLSRTPATAVTWPREPCRGCGADLTGLSKGRRYCSDACKPRCTEPDCNRKVVGRHASATLRQRRFQL